MRLALPMTLFAAALAVAALMRGGWYLVLLWPAAAFAVVAGAYFFERPGLFGKRANGNRSSLHAVVLAPYLGFNWLLWRVSGVRDSRPWAEVAPGLWIGRRPSPQSLPADVRTVLDLTCEFRPPQYRHDVRVHCLPVLDETAGNADAMLAAAQRFADDPALFVHCAEGRGRSGLFVAVLLLVRGEAATADEAWKRVVNARASARLNPQQQTALGVIADAVNPVAHTPSGTPRSSVAS